MSKIIDITDKLSFEEKPKFTVKGIEFEANNDAITIVKVSAVLEEVESPKDILNAFELLFDKENQEKIESLKLSLEDFMTLVMSVATSVMNNTDEQGETPTPAMT